MNFSASSFPHSSVRRKTGCSISWTCRNARLRRSLLPGLILPPTASSCLLQTMKTLTGTKQSVENARPAFLQQCTAGENAVDVEYTLARPGNAIISQPSKYSLVRQHTLSSFQNPSIIQLINLHCCGPAITYPRHYPWGVPFLNSSLPFSLWAQQWCLNLFHTLYSNYNHQTYKLAHCVQKYACHSFKQAAW